MAKAAAVEQKTKGTKGGTELSVAISDALLPPSLPLSLCAKKAAKIFTWKQSANEALFAIIP